MPISYNLRMEVLRKYNNNAIGLTEPHRNDYRAIATGMNSLRPKDTVALTQGLLDITEILQPSAHFSDVIRTFTKPIPSNGVVLFLACGRGEELVRTRDVYKSAKFIAIEKDLSPMLAFTAATTKTEVWPADLYDLEPDEIKEFVGKTPDLTIIRMPHPRDAFWPNLVTSFALNALQDKKQLLVTNLHIEERKRVFKDLDRLKIPSRVSLYEKSPRVNVKDYGVTYREMFDEPGIEVGRDLVVTVVGEI